MASELEKWARIERVVIEEEINFLKAGAKLLSPSGNDITADKLQQLERRLEHVQMALRKIGEDS